MAVKLVVFRLKSGRHETADRALKELGDYLNQALNGKIVIAPGKSEDAADAVWQGLPFIIVGERAEVQSLINRLSSEARQILDDCAYYWILSDSDQYLLSPERTIVLNWDYTHFEIIASRLKLLLKSPRLAGLSRSMHHIRLEIERIASGDKGPWTSTLILGESGTGKEEVAQTLYATSGRRGKFTTIACGWFTEGMLQDQLFGHKRGAFSGAFRDKEGLLEANSNGAVFLDDLDAAVKTITGALLRVMATDKGKAANVYRIGEEDIQARETSVWLIFSTNANISKMIDDGELREDFIFRFGDRVIHIPPLHSRPADFPAIAHHLWDELWFDNKPRKRFLSPLILQHLLARETQWKGNVRALQALLSLATSMANLPAHNQHSLRQIVDEIMSRGREYIHWVGIIAAPSFTGQIPTGNPDIQAILKLDEGFYCGGLSKNSTAASQTKSELEAQACLKDPPGKARFAQALKQISPRSKANVVRRSVRLARLIVYVARRNQIDKHLGMELCKVVEATVVDDLELLRRVGLLTAPKKEESNLAGRKVASTQAIIYEKVATMFN